MTTMTSDDYKGRVFLDGAEVEKCIAFNRHEGWVDIEIGWNGRNHVNRRVFGYIDTIPDAAK